MLAAGFITPTSTRTARAEPIAIANRKPAFWDVAPWYAEHVRTLLEEQYGRAFATLGLQVHTAVDLRLQRIAEEVLTEGLRTIERRLGWRRTVRHLAGAEIDAFLERQRASRPRQGPQQAVVTAATKDGLRSARRGSRDSWRARARAPRRAAFRAGDVVSVDPVARGDDGVMRFALDSKPQVEGALVAIDPETGQVKALVGGVDFRRSQFNRAVQARRQPGSAFKPFIYAAAIDHGYTAATIVTDAPISLPDGRRGAWTPKNFDNRYMGPVPLRTALIELAQHRVGAARARRRHRPAARLPADLRLPDRLPPHLSLALGSSEVTLLDLTRAYGVFATLGRRFEPVFITAVTDPSGRAVDFPGSRPALRARDESRDRVRRDRHDARRGRVGDGHRGQEARAAGRRQDRHDERLDGRLVRRLHPRAARRRLGRLRRRALARLAHRRPRRHADLDGFMQRALEGRPVRDFAKPEDVDS